jgi:hypothetical protein
MHHASSPPRAPGHREQVSAHRPLLRRAACAGGGYGYPAQDDGYAQQGCGQRPPSQALGRIHAPGYAPGDRCCDAKRLRAMYI